MSALMRGRAGGPGPHAHRPQGSRDPDTPYIRDVVCEVILSDDCEPTVYDTGRNLEAFHDDIVDRMIEFVD